MVKLLSVVSVFLLFFTGITALIGGGALIINPSGAPLKMSTALLAGSPFDTFFLPGLILFLFLGVSCIIIAFLVIKDNSYSTRLVFNQGIVVLGWIAVQVLLIGKFHFLQMPYLAIGVVFVYAGYLGIEKKSLVKS